MSRILIADDAAFMRRILKYILCNHGYEIAGEAFNGNDAIDKFQNLNPDLVTLDITMPGCDGISVLKKIISINSNARVIMCSAMGQQHLINESIQNGAKDFIVKPFQSDRVLEAVKKALD